MVVLNLNISLFGCFLQTVCKLNWRWFYFKNFYHTKFLLQKKKEYYIEPPCVCHPGSIIFNAQLSCISYNPATLPSYHDFEVNPRHYIIFFIKTLVCFSRRFYHVSIKKIKTSFFLKKKSLVYLNQDPNNKTRTLYDIVSFRSSLICTFCFYPHLFFPLTIYLYREIDCPVEFPIFLEFPDWCLLTVFFWPSGSQTF